MRSNFFGTAFDLVEEKTKVMSKEKSYEAILAQAKKFMQKGNVSEYIQTLFKAHQLRTAQQAI